MGSLDRRRHSGKGSSGTDLSNYKRGSLVGADLVASVPQIADVAPSEFAAAGLDSTVVLPTSTQLTADAFPLRARVPAGVCGLSEDSDILVDQILAWDNSLFRKDLGPLPEALRDEVQRALREVLDL